MRWVYPSTKQIKAKGKMNRITEKRNKGKYYNWEESNKEEAATEEKWGPTSHKSVLRIDQIWPDFFLINIY